MTVTVYTNWETDATAIVSPCCGASQSGYWFPGDDKARVYVCHGCGKLNEQGAVTEQLRSAVMLLKHE